MAFAPAEEVFHSKGLWWQKPQPWSWETSQAIAFPRGSRSGQIKKRSKHVASSCRLRFDVFNMFYLRLLIVLEAVGVISKCIVQFCQQDPWVQVNALGPFIIISWETFHKVEFEVGWNKATLKGHEGKALQKENNIFFEGETAVRLANAPTAPWWGFQVWFRARSLLGRREEKSEHYWFSFGRFEVSNY